MEMVGALMTLLLLSVSVILATLQWNTVHVHDVNVDDCTGC